MRSLWLDSLSLNFDAVCVFLWYVSINNDLLLRSGKSKRHCNKFAACFSLAIVSFSPPHLAGEAESE